MNQKNKTLGMTIDRVLGDSPLPSHIGDIVISSLTIDSRQVEQGSIFFAIAGLSSHGKEYIAAAINC